MIYGFSTFYKTLFSQIYCKDTQFIKIIIAYSLKMYTFASVFSGKRLRDHFYLGLTGFDSG